MEGSVTVPYTPVNGISLYSDDGGISGSSLGGGQSGSVNVLWREPGGIVGTGKWYFWETAPGTDVGSINSALYNEVNNLLLNSGYDSFHATFTGSNCVFVGGQAI